MTGVGTITIERRQGSTLVTRADAYVLIDKSLLDLLRDQKAGWAIVEDDILTLIDDVAVYRYRLVPHSPETVAGQLLDRTDR